PLAAAGDDHTLSVQVLHDYSPFWAADGLPDLASLLCKTGVLAQTHRCPADCFNPTRILTNAGLCSPPDSTATCFLLSALRQSLAPRSCLRHQRTTVPHDGNRV